MKEVSDCRYANLGDYNAAENDLDKALTMNRNHGNAQAYMVETLLQAAKKYALTPSSL